MILQITKFKSAWPDDEVLRLYKARSPQYRAVRGLIQKYYLRFPETGEHGAVYVWESEAAMRKFRGSRLARSIPEVYRVQGAPNIEVSELMMTLYDFESAKSP